MNQRSPHTFHIPVMGTGFTIDTPLKVARYGISSVVSLVDDVLIEQMREFHCRNEGLAYRKIQNGEPDARARRITAYLNLMGDLVREHCRRLQAGPFEPGSEITRYFEMLPEGILKREYREMLTAPDPARKSELQDLLRPKAVSGSIDVNIMTKLDRARYSGGQPLPPEFSDAAAALRGFAKSSLSSSIVFSAGMNQRLYSYAAQFEDFLPDEMGALKKKIVLKVSDYRSAEIQGKFLAKRGLWVSEYRIESGLNCGGHAFATRGHLMGPILDEFKRRKVELLEKLREIYRKALEDRQWRFRGEADHPAWITAQGGIGAHEEDRLLLKYYELDGTGWGTPFMLVPEATNVYGEHLEKLARAREPDVYLSDSSPLGVPFWTLRESQSERARRERIRENKPGSACPKGYLAANREFTELPVCTASRVYQKLKLRQLSDEDVSGGGLSVAQAKVTAKACICHDLAGGATVKNGIEPRATTAVCCGPNIVNFSRVSTLEEMVGHIYGRLSLITNPDRPHMFIRELKLYLDHFRGEIAASGPFKDADRLEESLKNLSDGVEHYRGVVHELKEGSQGRFMVDLAKLQAELLEMVRELQGARLTGPC